MSDPVDELLDILDLAPAGHDRFTGSGSGRVEFGLFGGHQLAQSVVAAQRSVEPGRLLHSVHAHFLRGGDGAAAVDYTVERVRDGRAFCTRRVTGEQSGKAIFQLTASFHVPEEGNGLISPSMPEGLAAPETLPSFADCIAEVGPIFGEEWSLHDRPVDYRIAHAPWAPTGPSPRGGIDYWFRVNRAVSDEPGLHEAVLAYMSDDCLADVVLVPYGKTWGSEGVMMVSLDHSMWFHQPARADEWIYVEQWPDIATGARGLAHSRMWQDGKLVASCAQEALVRF